MPATKKYGADTEYRMIHLWVEKQLGKPKQCSKCGLSDPKRRYHWANISQEYKRDLSDWLRLCVPCHRRQLAGVANDECLKGHKLTPDNLYTFPKRGEQQCIKCKRERRKNYTQKMKGRIYECSL